MVVGKPSKECFAFVQFIRGYRRRLFVPGESIGTGALAVAAVAIAATVFGLYARRWGDQYDGLFAPFVRAFGCRAEASQRRFVASLKAVATVTKLLPKRSPSPLELLRVELPEAPSPRQRQARRRATAMAAAD